MVLSLRARATREAIARPFTRDPFDLTTRSGVVTPVLDLPSCPSDEVGEDEEVWGREDAEDMSRIFLSATALGRLDCENSRVGPRPRRAGGMRGFHDCLVGIILVCDKGLLATVNPNESLASRAEQCQHMKAVGMVRCLRRGFSHALHGCDVLCHVHIIVARGTLAEETSSVIRYPSVLYR